MTVRSVAVKWALLCLMPVLILGAAGCGFDRRRAYLDGVAGRLLRLPSKNEIYEEIEQARAGMYRDWHRGDDDVLQEVQGDLTLEDAIAMALVKNPGLQGQLEERVKSMGLIEEAYAQALPTVVVTGRYARLHRGLSYPNEMGVLEGSHKNTWTLAADARQPLYRGGAVGTALRAARLFRYLSDETIRQATQDVIYETARTYWDYRLALRLVGVFQSGVESAERQLADVKAKREEGVATDFDQLRAEVEAANFRTELIQQTNAMRLARARLYRVMGVSQLSEATPAEELRYVEVKAEFADALGVAVLRRPDVFTTDLAIRLQQEGLDAVRSEYLPTADLFVTADYSKPGATEGDYVWGDSWQAGVSARWEIFSGWRTHGREVQQMAELRQAEIDKRDAMERGVFEVRRAFLDLESAVQLVDAQRLNQESANLALELAEASLEAGVSTPLEVTDARTSSLRAQGNYYNALHAHTIARMDLERAVGLLAPEPGAEDLDGWAVPVPGRLQNLAEHLELAADLAR